MKEQTRWTPKRLLSLLLALVMLLGMMPTAVFAADNETSEWPLRTFKDSNGDPQEVVVFWGNITSDTQYYLYIYVNPDPATPYAPNDRVAVEAIAELKDVDDSEVTQLKATIAPDGIGNAGEESNVVNNTTKVTLEYPTTGSSNIKVGRDGSISFWVGITYDVTIDGTRYTNTRNAPIKVTNLWTGYNVTYQKTAVKLLRASLVEIRQRQLRRMRQITSLNRYI